MGRGSSMCKGPEARKHDVLGACQVGYGAKLINEGLSFIPPGQSHLGPMTPLPLEERGSSGTQLPTGLDEGPPKSPGTGRLAYPAFS